MWLALASSLALLQFNKTISFGLLFIVVILGWENHVLDLHGILILFTIGIVCYLRITINNIFISGFAEILLVIMSLLLIFHALPGFNNQKIIDAVKVGQNSAPFSMYFNFDKALIPFLLVVCLGSLFTDGVSYKVAIWKWACLCLAVPVLLLLATLSGGLKPESHFPVWLPQFILANIFFVSLAEEAFFRGYLQQRLSSIIHPVGALLICAALFGGVHYAGGPLLVIFASLAGIIYGLAWMWSKRLWVSVLFHFGLNLCHLLFFTYPILQVHRVITP